MEAPIINSQLNIEEVLTAYNKGEITELPSWLKDGSNGIEIIPQELHMHIEDTYSILSVKRGNMDGLLLYKFNGQCYELLTESDCKSFIKSFLPKRYRKPTHWEMVYKELTTNDTNTKEMDLNANEDIIVFQNGVLDIRTNELLSHDPKYFSTIQIPCNYRKGLTLDDAPLFKKYLDDLTSGDIQDQTTLLEIIGLIISNAMCYRFKKLLVLQGLGNTGKTVLREFVMSLIGNENAHTIDIKKLHSQFGLSEIYSKRLIGDGDLKDASLGDISIIKALTGGDNVNMEGKYQNGYQHKFKGFLWFNCNDLPSFGGDRGKHVYERFIIISCNNVIPVSEQDKKLQDKLIDEREAIVSVAIQHLQHAIKRGYVFTESEIVIINREEYELENNTLTKFVREQCVIGSGRTSTKEFYDSYIKWCREYKKTPEKKSDIKKMLKEQFGVVERKSNDRYCELRITD